MVFAINIGPYLKGLKQIFIRQSLNRFKKIVVLLFLLSFKIFIVVNVSKTRNFTDNIRRLSERHEKKEDISVETLMMDQEPIKTSTIIRKGKNYKSILIWNSPERIETAVFGSGHEPFLRHGCEIFHCEIFHNETALQLKDYDAIVMNMHVIWLTELPFFKRRQHQRFIFMTQESPASMFLLNASKLKNYFNWTMSYRLNSDIQFLYGRIHVGPSAPKTVLETRQLIEATQQPSAKNYAYTKKQLVAWMASHCNTPSLRETYVNQLKKFISVDVYGECGKLSCDRNESHWLSDAKCYAMLEEKYKFYLSFENSICDDYVTEKFFEIMKRNIVPIVYGGANYTQIAPSHSYIDALQFTPEKLAEYLKTLDANDTLYNEYFWWKDYYTVEAGVEQMARHGFCDLCEKLHRDWEGTKYYPELTSEWHPKKRCKRFDSWES
ncbi:putative Alpha--fucosyltransferase C [Daphnia magna]|uniref:Fucosyltransferase n=1 Tax=Daphnia magna TaxID=35525 RepID=A0A0N8D7Z4_9CRUS|nr:putative Alpha--fucosyltransferase C [Daphnia magna]